MANSQYRENDQNKETGPHRENGKLEMENMPHEVNGQIKVNDQNRFKKIHMGKWSKLGTMFFHMGKLGERSTLGQRQSKL